MSTAARVRQVGDLYELEGEVQGSLYNPDLAPTPLAARSWSTLHIASLWVGLVVCVPTYNLASGLIAKGMSWWQAILTITLGNAIVLVPMVLNAHAGTKYGVPFPVLIRASFGTVGANIPSILRGLVACGWFGIQTWIGGAALYACWLAITGSAASDTGVFAAFFLFWALNMYFIWAGTESIKWMETLAAPFLIACGLALLFWAVSKAGGLAACLSPELVGGVAKKGFGQLFWPGLTAMVGFWATLSLNIPDFTRFARSQRDQLLGQAIGLPITMALFCFIGVAVTGATIVIYGQAIWDPVELVKKMSASGEGGAVVTIIAMAFLAVATLTTNIAANVVAPANAISNLFPRAISFKVGGLITGVIGIVMQPWKILASPDTYIFDWLIGYSALLGPIAGVMIADYYMIRRGKLDLAGLYQSGGPYRYGMGVNWIAVVALVLGILPNVPGFLVKVHLIQESRILPVFLSLFDASWFVGFAIAFVTYSLGMKFFGEAAPE